MADERITALVRRYNDLKGGRFLWEGHWEDLARVMLPYRAGFTTDFTPGEKRMDGIYDGTPMQAARGLANAMEGIMWPDGQTNVYIKASDDALKDDDAAKAWFADTQDRMTAAMNNPRARLRQARGEVGLDLAVLGTGILFTGERKKLDGLLYQSVHLKDAVVLFSEEGEAEGLMRKKPYTLRQAMERFGEENLSENTRKKIVAKSFDEKIMFLQVVIPRAEGRAGALLAKNLPFSSSWIEMAESHEVEVGGFHEFPFAIPRWDTSAGEDYGQSPGMIALPDANTLQAMGETILVAGQRAADPALLMPNDGFMDAPNTFPGGLAYYDADLAKELGRIPIQALEVGTNLPISRDMQKDTREQIFAAFFKNVLNLPVAGPAMTATEINARKEEFIREIGPVFGRLESDYTGPKVERTFQIMLRAGAFPPIPPVLQGQSIRFEYESPVKKIRQQIEAAAARAWVVERLEIAKETQDQSHLDLVNFDEYARISADAGSVPHKIVVGKDEVEAKRAGRAKAQQAAAQQQQIAQSVDVAAQAGKIPGVQEAVGAAVQQQQGAA
jgi:hypothetical protein